jgi:hypothetical protein
MDAATVCRAFETFRRRKVLSFGHHAVLASLQEPEVGLTGQPMSVSRPVLFF